MPSPIDPFLNQPRIAYFTMEMAIRPEMHTYSGGLGVLAGDTARSAADLDLPMVFVTLVNRAGYFRQTIDAGKGQTEQEDWWQPADWCTPLDTTVTVEIERRPVSIRPWLYLQSGADDHTIPILLLDTDLEQNTDDDREITHRLYGGDEAYRLKQEIVLGIGGARIVRALGFDVRKYHLNEGHAALLTLDLLSRLEQPAKPASADDAPADLHPEIRKRCVFTTHTPVAAGQDRFSYALFEKIAPELVAIDTVKALAGTDELNMTRLALNLSGYVNGVAERHAVTTEGMFPGYPIRAITNGVHIGTWTHDAFANVFDAKWPRWRHEPEILVRVLGLSDDDIQDCRRAAKRQLIASVKALTGVALDLDVPIVSYARRMTEYKRPGLLFSDPDRLSAIAGRHPFQILMAGKAHPRDGGGKEAVHRVQEIAAKFGDRIKIAFLPGYDTGLAKDLVGGSDIWLNTPVPPLEASGTSGMKAALNGVLNLSVLDGWWAEACLDGVNGWAIGTDGDGGADTDHAAALYDKLENAVLPLFHGDRAAWCRMMKQAIATIAPYFNSDRMMRRYAAEAYFR